MQTSLLYWDDNGSKVNPSAPTAERVVEILVDYACAARCPFCYNPPLTTLVLSRRLSFSQAARLLLERRREGYDGAWFTGGEVTQRRDLPQLLRAARKLDYRLIQIGTNGWRTADAGYSRLLSRAGLNYARVSIHGASARVHDRLLGLPGAYRRARASLRALRAAGVSVGVNFVLNGANVDELPAFVTKALGRWKVADIDVLFPHYRGMMAENAAGIGLTYRRAVPAVSAALRRARALDARPGQLRLVNFPPCVLAPRAREWVVDWRRDDFLGHELARPEGRTALAEVKSEQKSQGPGCSGCALSGECAGFERDYAARFGTSEFSAL